MTSRHGILSDEHTLEHCKMYQPIPLGAAQYVLNKELGKTHSAVFGRQPKYIVPQNRPGSFSFLANRLAQNTKQFDELNSMYSSDLKKAPNPVFQRRSMPSNPAGPSNIMSNYQVLSPLSSSDDSSDDSGVVQFGRANATPPTNRRDTLEMDAETFLRDLDRGRRESSLNMRVNTALLTSEEEGLERRLSSLLGERSSEEFGIRISRGGQLSAEHDRMVQGVEEYNQLVGPDPEGFDLGEELNAQLKRHGTRRMDIIDE